MAELRSSTKTKLVRETWLVAVLALLLCSCTAFLSLRHKQSLAEVLGYGVLPATQSLLQGEGLTVCSSELAKTPGNPICLHSARMPMAEVVIASGIKLLGTNVTRLTFYKAVLLLLPLVLAGYLVYDRLLQVTQHRRLVLLLLLAPFTIFSFLQNVVRLDFEEAYSYSFIALAFAMTYFWNEEGGFFYKYPYFSGITVAACTAGVYLSKSSMSLFAVAFLAVYLRKPTGPRVKVMVLLLSALAPLGWALYQHHASGRYSLGTSLDGFNLHMGNSEHFLRDYPPHAGVTLDDTAVELNAGVHFKDEWALNDYHQRAAILFVRSHPRQALSGELHKFSTIFFSTNVVGTYASPGILTLVSRCGVIVFRLMFSASLMLSILNIFHGNKRQREVGFIFLLFSAAIVLPYMAGFAYTRHITVLAFPCSIFCCKLLLTSDPSKPSLA